MALYDQSQQHGPGVSALALHWQHRRTWPLLIGLGTALSDLGMIVMLSILAAGLYAGISGGSVDYSRSQESALVLSALLITWSARDGSYAARSLAAWSPPKIIAKWLLSAGLFIIVAYLLKSGASYSRGTLLSFVLLGIAGLLASRYLVARIIRDAVEQEQLPRTRVAVVAIGEEEDKAVRTRIAAAKTLSVTDYVLVRPQDEDLASVRRVVGLSRAGLIDEILIAQRWNCTELAQRVVAMLRDQALPVHVLPDGRDVGYTSRPSRLGRLPVFELKGSALGPGDLLLKRSFDVVVASACLILFSPVLLATAAAIKLESPGPVFFRQRRHGFNNREFRIFKFRSMTVAEDGPTVTQATRNDRRVTRIGRFIRKTSIDELPQLLNVLRGEMSIVGPRPHAVAHNDAWVKLVENYAQRHNILPGITGLAQVNGLRGEADTPEKICARVSMDLAYIERWSMALDMKIVFKTALVLLFQKTAY